MPFVFFFRRLFLSWSRGCYLSSCCTWSDGKHNQSHYCIWHRQTGRGHRQTDVHGDMLRAVSTNFWLLSGPQCIFNFAKNTFNRRSRIERYVYIVLCSVSSVPRTVGSPIDNSLAVKRSSNFWTATQKSQGPHTTHDYNKQTVVESS